MSVVIPPPDQGRYIKLPHPDGVRHHGRVWRINSGGFYWWEARCTGCHRHGAYNDWATAFAWAFLHVRGNR